MARRRLIVSAEDRENLRDITAYVRAHNRSAARRVAERFELAFRTLAEMPGIGRVVDKGMRRYPAVWPYVVRYRFDERSVTIISIRHGARALEGPTDA